MIAYTRRCYNGSSSFQSITSRVTKEQERGLNET